MSISNSALNAMKHGCCAVEASLLPTESAADFKALENIWLQAYTLSNEIERHLVADLVNADWLLQRTTRTYLDIETRLYTQNPNPLDWTEQHQRKNYPRTRQNRSDKEQSHPRLAPRKAQPRPNPPLRTLFPTRDSKARGDIPGNRPKPHPKSTTVGVSPTENS